MTTKNGTIHKLTKALNDARDAMKKEGKAAFRDVFKEVFDEHPKLQAIRWSQYTPYFNDKVAA